MIVGLAAVACGGAGWDRLASRAQPPAAPLASDRQFGYIKEIDISTTPATITFDRAEFLTGQDAYEAAVADGAILSGEPVANDYYIRNPSSRLLILPAAAEVRVTAVRCPTSCHDGVPGDFSALAASFANDEPKYLSDDYRGAQSQYWITVEDGLVTAIDEQYVP